MSQTAQTSRPWPGLSPANAPWLAEKLLQNISLFAGTLPE